MCDNRARKPLYVRQWWNSFTSNATKEYPKGKSHQFLVDVVSSRRDFALQAQLGKQQT